MTEGREIVNAGEHVHYIRDSFKERYAEIEKRAVDLIASGQTVDNPILTGAKKDTRYALATCVLLDGQVDQFLTEVTHQLQAIEPDRRSNSDGFRHIALRELMFNHVGRKAEKIPAEQVKYYYNLLQAEFAQGGTPIQLELVRLLPAIDREQPSVSLTAAFLPLENLALLETRSKIKHALETSGYPLTARLGDIPVIFSTLCRFPHPPKRIGDAVVLLDFLQRINENMPPNLTATATALNVISTTQISYVWADKHIYLYPPIYLNQPNPTTTPRFLTPRQLQETRD